MLKFVKEFYFRRDYRMPKCQKCGREFEGNFCPYCGEKSAGENRGETVDKTAADLQTVSNGQSLEKVYNILDFVPAVLLVLFSALLFAFFALPVAEIVLGEGMPKESLGNLYSMNNGIFVAVPTVKITLIVLLVLAIVSLLAAAAVAVVTLPRYNRIVATRFGGLSVSRLAAYVAAAVVYLVMIIMGVVVIAQIKATEEGKAGMLAAGTGPILVLVFAAVFAALTVAAAVVSHMIAKKQNSGAFKYRKAYLNLLDEYSKGLPEPEKPEMSAALKAKVQAKGLSEEKGMIVTKNAGRNKFRNAAMFVVIGIIVLVASITLSATMKTDLRGPMGMIWYIVAAAGSVMMGFGGIMIKKNESIKYYLAYNKYSRRKKLYEAGKNYTGGKSFEQWLSRRGSTQIGG